ncbi:hypothetical protein D3C72_1982920 [compost metagenome]
MQQRTGRYKAPLHPTPLRHHLAAQPPAQRQPDDGIEHRGEQRKAGIAARLLGHDVPERMDDARNNDQRKRVERHVPSLLKK